MSRLAIAFMLTSILIGAGVAQGPVSSHAPTAPTVPAAPATASAPLPPTAVVARVNGVALTQADLTEAEQALFPYYQQHNGRIPASAEPEIHQEALHRIVLDELQYQEARRRNLKLSEPRLQKGLQELVRKFGSRQAYHAAIVKKYGSEAAFERRVRRNLLVRQLWDLEVTRKSLVTPAELRAYYQKNPANFVRPESVSIQSISFIFPADATEQQKEKSRNQAEGLLAKARACKNYEEFGVLAEQVSEDPWHVMMGDHKWVHRGQVDPQFEPIFSMKPGETSSVLESKEGFHILRLNDHQAQRQMTFDEIRDRLRKDLQAKRRDERA
jgi:parvulin-like peptidyl-prolyl isomerase